MLCIGACMVFVEGMLAHFFNTQYSKSLEFGGVLLGVAGVVYSATSFVLGSLRSCFPRLLEVFLVGGLVGAGAVLPFIGPLIHLPGLTNLATSVCAFNLLPVFSCAIQLNCLTVSAQALTRHVSSEQAMSVAMNTINLAYNVGAFAGPVVGGFLLERWGFAEVFATGSPFFLVSAVAVMINLLLLA